MTRLPITSAAVPVIAVLMTMTGRGGGDSRVLSLEAAGAPMHQAATRGQLILKRVCACTTLAGAVYMDLNAVLSRSG